MKTRQYLILFACAQVVATTLVAMHDPKVYQTEEAQPYWRIPVAENLVNPTFDLTKSFSLCRSDSSKAGYYLSFSDITTRDERTNAEQIANQALIDQAERITNIHLTKEQYQELNKDEEFQQRLKNIDTIEDRREKICWILQQMRKHELEISETSIDKLRDAFTIHAQNHKELAKLVQQDVQIYAKHSFEAHRSAFKLSRVNNSIGYIEKFDPTDIKQLATYLAGEKTDKTKHFNINNKDLETTDFTKSFLHIPVSDYIQEEDEFSYYFYNSPYNTLMKRAIVWQTAIVFAYLANKKHFDYYSGYDMDEYTADLKKNQYLAEDKVQTIFNEYRKAFDYTLEYIKNCNDIESRWWVHLESVKTLIPLMFIAQKAYNKVAITVNFLNTWREALLDYADNERTLLRQTLTLCANELARDHFVLKELAETCINTDYKFNVPDADFTDPELIVSGWLPGDDPIDYEIYPYAIEMSDILEIDTYSNLKEYNEHAYNAHEELSYSGGYDPYFDDGNY